jgi:predicted enzyme related to lactoylglutathione lyase
MLDLWYAIKGVIMIGKLKTVALDAADHRALAHFYRDLFDGEVPSEDDDWAVVTTPDGWRLGFQPAPDHVPPRWPSQDAPQQIHLDMQVPDKDAARARAESLGATHAGGGDRWHVMLDPAGHPFCLSETEQTEPIKMFGANVDCPDPKALAAFYGELLGMDLKYEGDEGGVGMAWIGDDSSALRNVLFQGVADYSAPQWPDPAHPQQLHFDVTVADIDVAEEQVLKIGAEKRPGGGDDFRVYVDPAGHPFCLVW